MNRRLFLAATAASLAPGCGFQLRRVERLSLASLYLEAPPGSRVGQLIRSAITTEKLTRLTGSAAEAEAVLRLEQESRSRSILTLSGAGRVTEFRLGLKLTYSVVGRDGQILAAPETLDLISDMTYDDTQVLAKAAEEQLLFRHMEETAALRILRRLQNLGNGAAQ
jgi:LPS-assembly lipoprotein